MKNTKTVYRVRFETKDGEKSFENFATLEEASKAMDNAYFAERHAVEIEEEETTAEDVLALNITATMANDIQWAFDARIAELKRNLGSIEGKPGLAFQIPVIKGAIERLESEKETFRQMVAEEYSRIYASEMQEEAAPAGVADDEGDEDEEDGEVGAYVVTWCNAEGIEEESGLFVFLWQAKEEAAALREKFDGVSIWECDEHARMVPVEA